MAHFAQLDENNNVVNVIVVANTETSDANGVEDESIGVGFCKRLFGSATNWIQTSYNGNFRKNFAGIGYTYDAQRDAFIPPKPFASWVLVEETCQWEAPVPYPNNGTPHYWDEANVSWVPVTE